MDTRDKIIAEARTFMGTPHHHQGRLKGVGIDCVGLVVQCARSVGISIKDREGYTSRPTGILPKELEKAGFVEIPLDERQPGDVGVFWFYKSHLPQHAAIFSMVGKHMGLIHTYNDAGKVIEQRMPETWRNKLVHVFKFPGVE